MCQSSIDIKTELLPGCPLCGHPENSVVHQNLRDHLFFAPGTWTFSRCRNCDVVFLNPRPVRAEIHKAYTELYSTRKKTSAPSANGFLTAAKHYVRRGYYAYKHGYVPGTTRVQRGIGAMLSLMPIYGRRMSSHIMGIPHQPAGRLVDVGCGVGGFMALMSDLGWRVQGVDADPLVVESCTRIGLEAHVGTLEDMRYSDESFDVVTSSHVIEHVYDPESFLAEIRRILRIGGTAYLRTPNIDGFGHRSFREFWLGLEAPRHLFVFSPRTLTRAAQSAGFSSVKVFTTARISRVNSLVARELRDHNRVAYRSSPGLRSRLGAHLDATRVRLQLLLGSEIGDELVLIAKK